MCIRDRESACVHYYIRAPRVAQMLDIKRRVDDVARGAALMTGTALTIREVDGFSDYVPNRAPVSYTHLPGQSQNEFTQRTRREPRLSQKIFS